VAKSRDGRRQRGRIRQRGNSFQVVVYAGEDPLTGRRSYLNESTTDEAEARRILTRLVAQVDAQRHAKTSGSFRVAMESWLRTHDVEEITRTSYEQYARVHLYPAFGDVTIGKVGTRLLEEFYADLRHCRSACSRRPPHPSPGCLWRCVTDPASSTSPSAATGTT